MVADVLEAVKVLGVVEALVLDLPATFGHAEDGATARPPGREVGEPVGFEHRAVGLVLPIADHAHGFPAESFPRIKVVGVPDLHPILTVAEDLMRTLMAKALLGCRPQFREIVFQPGDDGEAQVSRLVQEGGGGEPTIDDHIVGKAWAEVPESTAQQSATGVVLALPRAVRFHIQGQASGRFLPR